MKRNILKNVLFVIICCLVVICITNVSVTAADLTTTASLSQNFPLTISTGEQQKIDAAAPVKATVKPLQKRKLLVVTLNVRDGKVTKGHNSIPYANYAIKMMGDKTGAYETFFSNDTMIFKPENLAQFDAICFNNTVGVLFDDPELRQSLLDYVYSGKGFIGIHAAGATFVQWPVYDQWPAFGEMLGGYENGGHPWGPHEWITLKVDEPGHPVNAAFKGKGFEISDEVFQFQEPYSRDKLRVLLTIDTDKTDMSEQRYILPERRADKDLAISWLRNYGRGRVFYSTLGHNPHINWDMKILQHYLDGFQFALGDLPSPTTPSNKLTAAVKAQEKLGWHVGIFPLNKTNTSFFETVDKTATPGLLYTGAADTQPVSKNIPNKFDYHLSPAEIKQIKTKLDSAGQRLLSYYITNPPADATENRKLFEFGRKMGIEIFIIDPGPKLPLDEFEKLCREFDIKLAFRNGDKNENPDYRNAKQLKKLCKNKNDKFGVCLDLSRWMASGLKPVDAVKAFKNRLFVIQLHDLNELSGSGSTVSGQIGDFLRQVGKQCNNSILFGMDAFKQQQELQKNARLFNDFSIKQVRNLK